MARSGETENTCRRVDEDLTAYFQGELAPERHTEVEAHVASCVAEQLWSELGPPPTATTALELPAQRDPSLPAALDDVWQDDAAWHAALVHASCRIQRQDDFELTFEKRLEQEKLLSMKQLAYGASHEINNPLANIATRAQTLMADEPDPERRRTLAMDRDEEEQLGPQPPLDSVKLNIHRTRTYSLRGAYAPYVNHHVMQYCSPRNSSPIRAGASHRE